MLSVTVNTNLKQIHSKETSEVILPTSEGFIGVLVGHRPMICKLSFGELQLKSNGSYESLIVGDGVAEIYDDKVKILVAYAERPDDIDLERAMGAKERAEKRINDSSGDWDLDRARVALLRAITRIRLAGESQN